MHRVINLKTNNQQPGSRCLLRFGALAVFAGLGAGCSADAVRLTEPLFTSSTANRQAIVSGSAYTNAGYNQATPPLSTNMAVAQPNSIQRQPLPEPTGQAYRPAPNQTAGIQPVASAPRAYTPPKAYAPSGQPKALGTMPSTAVARAGAAPAVTSSATYVVQSGDSLWAIANKNGTTVAALRSANDLSGSSIRSGQKLVIPGRPSMQAPVRVAAAPSRTMTDAQLPVAAPSRNKPSAPLQVAVVQPNGAAVPATAKPKAYSPPANIKPTAPITPTATRDAAKSAEPSKMASADAAGFRWPVKGRIISGFGKKANGERNDGIDLAVPEGTSVKAAESGVVIYSGNELKSYGNLVLVRHENGWVSAYAHNKELLVKRGDQVARGQVISRAGMTGGVDSPQVHFELRKGATPVDPMQHLSDV